MIARSCKLHGRALLPAIASLSLPLFMTGCALFYGSDRSSTPTVAVSASPEAVPAGSSSTLIATALNATQITITGSDGSSYTLPGTGGTQTVTPSATTKYTATATGKAGSATANATVLVSTGTISSLNHIIFMLQENHSFDNYFGMLNPYRKANNLNIGDDGVDYEVDGIDDKLTSISNQNDENQSFPLFKFKSTCIDDASSDWLASFGDVNRYDFSTTRKIAMDGFVHNAEGYAKGCSQSGAGRICAGTFTDMTGKRVMGYYDQDYLNYYYYMASQFALSDRWFSPVASKSVDNRIATFTGGTTQGLVKDPGGDDGLPQLDIPTIFGALDQAKVSWKIYYIATQGGCGAGQPCTATTPNAAYPATDFSNLLYSKTYLYQNPAGSACTAPTQASSVVGDSSNSFCIDPTHVAPITSYFTDLTNGTLPAFAFIEAGYGFSDEHPGSGQSILVGQNEVASLVNALMQSPSWLDSVFFFSYDEGGGPYDHVPPVPGHSNDYTDASLQSSIADISTISVSPDSFKPCYQSPPTLHCDLVNGDPGTTSTDAAAVQGFGAQIGFRVPNFVVSPFVRKHFVSHIPMDHTAVIKFVEDRFLGGTSLTARDAAQPNMLDFFDFNKIPWLTPPTPPTPVTKDTLGTDPCTPSNL